MGGALQDAGISADFVRDFERWLNQKYQKDLGKRPFTVMIRPTTRDQLLSEVAEGRADIAVGNLTVKIGAETTTYVRNICKYYVAYKLMSDVADLQRKAAEGVVQQGK